MQAVSRENISQWIRENEQGLWPGLARERSQARTARQARGAGTARAKGLEQHTARQSAAQERTRQNGALWQAGAVQSVQRGAREEAAARPRGLEQHTARQTAAQERTRQDRAPWQAGAAQSVQRGAGGQQVRQDRVQRVAGVARPKTPWYQRTPRAWFRPLFAALLLVRQQRAAVGWAGRNRGETASGFTAAGSRRGETARRSGLAATGCSRGETASGFTAAGRSGLAAARCSGGAGDD